jgi:hypothetical protein
MGRKLADYDLSRNSPALAVARNMVDVDRMTIGSLSQKG